MSKPESKIERIKFIPEREFGEPEGEPIEGEVLYTSENERQKIVRTDNHSVYIIYKSDDRSYWEVVITAFDIERAKKNIEATSELMSLFGFSRQ